MRFILFRLSRKKHAISVGGIVGGTFIKAICQWYRLLNNKIQDIDVTKSYDNYLTVSTLTTKNEPQLNLQCI